MDKVMAKCVKTQAEKDNKVAHYIEGLCYALGTDGFSLNLGEAYKHLSIAAKLGHKKAQRIIDESPVIAGRHLIITEPIGDCIKVYSRLLAQMVVTVNKIEKYFKDNFTSFKDIYAKPCEILDVYEDFIKLFYQGVGDVLREFDIDIKKDEYFRDMISALPSCEKRLSFIDEVDAVYDKYENYSKEKENRPSSYGNFTGSSIVGSITASVLNYAVDTAAEAINSNNDRNKITDINNDLKAIYDKLIKKEEYLEWFKTDCRTIITYTLDELIGRGKLYKIDLSEWNKAADVSEIIEDGESDKESAISELMDLIEKKPYDYGLYVSLYLVDWNLSYDIYDFMKKYQMGYFLLSIINYDDPKYKFYKFPPFSLNH